MNTSLKYDFGEFSIFDNFIIGTMKEGVIITSNHNEVVLHIAKKYFKKKPFAYITNRIHSYSVDPTLYLETSKIKNLVAFAVVSEKELSISNTAIEKIFISKPYRHFNKLIDAIHWCESVIANFAKEKES